MTDDLGRRLEQLTARVPEGTPDLGEVFEGGRRLVRRRALASTAGIVAVISLVTFAALNLDLNKPAPGSVQPATHDDGVFAPAQPGEPTYVLTDLRIEYPWASVDGMRGFEGGSERRELYCSSPEREGECRSEGNAGFFYKWHWATDRFPGLVECRVELFSEDGREVGQQDWELTGLESRSRRVSDVLVHVSAEPARAEASCEAGTLDSGPTHRFTFVRAESYNANPRPNAQPTYRNRLYFEVETLTEHSSGMCRSTIRYESGKTVTSTFTLTGAPPEDRLFELGAPYRTEDPVEDGSIRCRLYKRDAAG